MKTLRFFQSNISVLLLFLTVSFSCKVIYSTDCDILCKMKLDAENSEESVYLDSVFKANCPEGSCTNLSDLQYDMADPNYTPPEVLYYRFLGSKPGRPDPVPCDSLPVHCRLAFKFLEKASFIYPCEDPIYCNDPNYFRVEMFTPDGKLIASTRKIKYDSNKKRATARLGIIDPISIRESIINAPGHAITFNVHTVMAFEDTVVQHDSAGKIFIDIP